MGSKINVKLNNLFTIKVEAGTKVEDIAKDYTKVTGDLAIGARINNTIVDFKTNIYTDTNITFFDYKDSDGNKIYQAGLKFIMILAAKQLWNKKVEFKYSLDKGIYAEIDKKINNNDLIDLSNKMHSISDDNYPINKCVVKKEDAIKYYKACGEYEKAENIQNIPNSFVVLYELNHLYNYFYSEMPSSTGVLKLFKLEKVGKNGIELIYPLIDCEKNLPDFYLNEKIFDELSKYSKWTKSLDVSYVSSLNKIISDGKIQMFIKMNNIFVNNSLMEASRKIILNKDIKMILIGGPSSSGKTTSARKLCTYLESMGKKPIVISTDDYFVNKKDTPKLENGEYDFESLKAMDLELFNKQMKSLIKGEEVQIPTYNFIKGEKQFVKPPIKMNENNILVIEGLHCLNEEMSKKMPRNNKFKILVCPFTPLDIDRHNHLSTTDMRLIRRIVRDNRTRGRNVEDTLREWPLVKKGESKNIFPFEYDVDQVINTAYAYEIGILRVYVEPLLYSVPIDSKYYEEARRLLGTLRTFFPITSEYIEDDNILREFIGGSIYDN